MYSPGEPIVAIRQCSEAQQQLAAQAADIGARKKALVEGTRAVADMKKLLGSGLHHPSVTIDADGNLRVGCLTEGSYQSLSTATTRLQAAGITFVCHHNGGHTAQLIVDPGQERFFEKLQAAVGRQAVPHQNGVAPHPNDQPQTLTR